MLPPYTVGSIVSALGTAFLALPTQYTCNTEVDGWMIVRREMSLLPYGCPNSRWCS